jgi:hypothetical protein
VSHYDEDAYEPVDVRLKRALDLHPDMRTVTELVAFDEKSATFKAVVYKSKEDLQANLPWATGFAQEFKGINGFANKFSWFENCETSAIGRALANAGLSGKKRPSQEEMKRISEHEAAAEKAVEIPPKEGLKKLKSIPYPGRDTRYIGKTLGEIPDHAKRQMIERIENHMATYKGEVPAALTDFLLAAKQLLEGK